LNPIVKRLAPKKHLSNGEDSHTSHHFLFEPT
jgi:hypothetical protein